jgi:cell division topological specificity factor
MRDLFSRLLGGPSRKSSKDDAKARLKFLLVHDHVDLTPTQMEAMKTEIMEVITRYVEVDGTGVEFRLEREAGTVALVSNIPVRRVTARTA